MSFPKSKKGNNFFYFPAFCGSETGRYLSPPRSFLWPLRVFFNFEGRQEEEAVFLFTDFDIQQVGHFILRCCRCYKDVNKLTFVYRRLGAKNVFSFLLLLFLFSGHGAHERWHADRCNLCPGLRYLQRVGLAKEKNFSSQHAWNGGKKKK